MPDTKYGTCPWCERENQRLQFVIAHYHDQMDRIWADWICADCLFAARRYSEETEPSE